MSVIHNSSALLGRRSALSDGTARCSTVRSIAYSRHASASTASPVHSRRPARGAAIAVTLTSRSMGLMSVPPVAARFASWPQHPALGVLVGGGTAQCPGAKDLWVSRVERKDRTPRVVRPDLRPLDADAFHPFSSCRVRPSFLVGGAVLPIRS